MVFLNVSNHPSSKWSAEQLEAAQQIGTLLDLPFPAVPATATVAEMQQLSDDLFSQIMTQAPACVMIQGEVTLVYNVVRRLQDKGIMCCAATTERNTDELGDGRKIVTFKFMGFREYF